MSEKSGLFESMKKKRNKEIITIGNMEIEKTYITLIKIPILIVDIDIDKILIYNNGSSSNKNYKCFIGYKDNNYKIKLLFIMLPQASAHVKSYDD